MTFFVSICSLSRNSFDFQEFHVVEPTISAPSSSRAPCATAAFQHVPVMRASMVSHPPPGVRSRASQLHLQLSSGKELVGSAGQEA